jgi:hypothetical protein
MPPLGGSQTSSSIWLGLLFDRDFTPGEKASSRMASHTPVFAESISVAGSLSHGEASGNTEEYRKELDGEAYGRPGVRVLG